MSSRNFSCLSIFFWEWERVSKIPGMKKLDPGCWIPVRQSAVFMTELVVRVFYSINSILQHALVLAFGKAECRTHTHAFQSVRCSDLLRNVKTNKVKKKNNPTTATRDWWLISQWRGNNSLRLGLTIGYSYNLQLYGDSFYKWLLFCDSSDSTFEQDPDKVQKAHMRRLTTLANNSNRIHWYVQHILNQKKKTPASFALHPVFSQPVTITLKFCMVTFCMVIFYSLYY